jgi:hypothetical protein
MKALFAEQRDVLAGNRQGAASGASPRELDAPHVDHPHRHRRSAA